MKTIDKWLVVLGVIAIVMVLIAVKTYNMPQQCNHPATIYGPSHFVVDVELRDEGGRHVLSVTRMEAGNKNAIVYRLPEPAGGGYAPPAQATEVVSKD